MKLNKFGKPRRYAVKIRIDLAYLVVSAKPTKKGYQTPYFDSIAEAEAYAAQWLKEYHMRILGNDDVEILSIDTYLCTEDNPDVAKKILI